MPPIQSMAMINNPSSELSREQHVPAMTLNQPDVTFIGNRFENSEVLFGLCKT